MNKPLKVYTSIFISVFTAIATTASSHFTGADIETVHPAWWQLLLEIVIKGIIIYCSILAIEDGFARLTGKKKTDDSKHS